MGAKNRGKNVQGNFREQLETGGGMSLEEYNLTTIMLSLTEVLTFFFFQMSFVLFNIFSYLALFSGFKNSLGVLNMVFYNLSLIITVFQIHIH